MYKIKITKDSCYTGHIDTYTVEQEEDSVVITHSGEGFSNYDLPSDIVKISLKEFKSIGDVFENINFDAILKESDVLNGYDGWILECTISNGMTKASVSLWCPEVDPAKPETTKLLQACEKIWALVGDEL